MEQFGDMLLAQAEGNGKFAFGPDDLRTAEGKGILESMRKATKISRTCAALALALLLRYPAPAQTPSGAQHLPAVAILEIANAGMDPRVDYLASIIQGLLAFDIGGRQDISLVDRRNLDAVLKEKELSLSALGQDTDSAAEAGRLAGADWLLSGEYVFLGSDVLLTLSLTDTATAKRVVFRDRGGSENLVHKLAEEVVLRLTGKTASFADPDRSRSLLSLRDETPGSIALFSPIIKAEVYLDEQFVGYTTGDAAIPLVLDKLSPGQHQLRVHLDSSFGVVKLPEVSFHDWETSVDIEPGKRSTLRDATQQFNGILYQLIELDSGSARAYDAESKAGEAPAKLAFSKELSFQDRTGTEIAVHVSAMPRMAGDSLTLDFTVSIGPKGQEPTTSAFSITLPSGEEGEKEGKTDVGIVKLDATLERRADYWSLDWSVERTDIRQNMWSE
jgi:hypothetical protein